MNIEDLRKYCLSLKGADEALPFDKKTLVFSVKGKMFCATDAARQIIKISIIYH